MTRGIFLPRMVIASTRPMLLVLRRPWPNGLPSRGNYKICSREREVEVVFVFISWFILQQIITMDDYVARNSHRCRHQFQSFWWSQLLESVNLDREENFVACLLKLLPVNLLKSVHRFSNPNIRICQLMLPVTSASHDPSLIFLHLICRTSMQ